MFKDFLSDAGLSNVLQVSVIRTACWVFSREMWLHHHHSPHHHRRPAGGREKHHQARLGTSHQGRALPGPYLTAVWRQIWARSTTRHTRSWGNTTGEFFDRVELWFVNLKSNQMMRNRSCRRPLAPLIRIENGPVSVPSPRPDVPDWGFMWLSWVPPGVSQRHFLT